VKKLVVLRRVSQVFFLLLFVYILWSTTYPLRGLLPAGTFFKTNPNIMIFTAISERIFLPGLVFAFMMLVITLVLGRFFCGWVCPLGTLMDWTASLKKKRRETTDLFNRKVRRVKFVVLGVIALASFFGMQIAWVLDPVVLAARFVSLNLTPTVTLLLDKAFIFIIRDVGFSGLHDFYRALKSSVLGVRVAYFANSGMIFAFFLTVLILTFFITRFWCRVLCPLGGIYSLIARFSLLRRVVGECIDCGLCRERCRMGAINDDISYSKGECILCMDCVYGCPVHVTKFTWPTFKGLPAKRDAASSRGLSRKEFIFLILSSVFFLGFRRGSRKKTGSVVRPPASLKEDEFINRCVRCGNCMKVCPTNVLQPSMLQAGLGGVWTPHLVNEIGYCEYNCVLCGEVCPTGAISKLPLAKKQHAKLGVAKVDRSICIAWSGNKECLVCEEHCPVPSKAIKIEEAWIENRMIGRPVVDTDLCIGCGICQYKCPVRPLRAITVSPEGAYRPKG